MNNIKIIFNKNKGLVKVYGQSMIFHCNHYNRSLQETIEDPNYIDSENIFLHSSAETVYIQLSEYFKLNSHLNFREKLNFASKMFKFAGFGIIDFSEVNENGGRVIVKSSHFGIALKLNMGTREKPGEYFDKGFIAGVFLSLKDSLKGSIYETGFNLIQKKSISLDNDISEFIIKKDNDFRWLDKIEPKLLPVFIKIQERKFTTNIDENKIVTTLSGMSIIGNDDGLIPYFGVYLTRMYADYYTKISYRFTNELVKTFGNPDIASELLVEAGHICGFNTMGGIMESAEWEALVLPMIQNKEDWMHGIVACINALGWGIWRVEELIPAEKLVIRIYEGYESLGYLKWFGTSKYQIDYLATGVSAALMNLLYLGEITKKPVLDNNFYFELFKNKNCFIGKQTKCLAMGDDYSEITVSKK